MHKASAYQALVQELELWRTMPRSELVAKVGAPASVRYASIDGEDIAVEVALHWHDKDRTAIRVVGVANGPSHWRLDRLEESVIISLVS